MAHGVDAVGANTVKSEFLGHQSAVIRECGTGHGAATQRKFAVQFQEIIEALHVAAHGKEGLIALEDGKIQIQASFLFPINGADLTAEGVRVIEGISKGLLDVLGESDVIMVSGFTDDTPVKSSTYTNWNLSTERAVNVVKTLIAQGFPPDRLFAAGFGEFQPKYPNDSDEHRRLNRRVEIGVTPLQKSSYEERKVK